MSDGTITTRVMREDDCEAVAEITVDRAVKLNVVNGALCRELTASPPRYALRRSQRAASAVAMKAMGMTKQRLPPKAAEPLEEVQGVVLHGTGRHALVGGTDVAEMAEFDLKSARTFVTDLHPCLRGIAQLAGSDDCTDSGLLLGRRPRNGGVNWFTRPLRSGTFVSFPP